MREWFRQLPAKIVEFWNRYTAKQKTLFFSVVAAVIITLVALFVILNRTSYTRLATFDNSAQTAEAETLLKENGIKHRVSDDAFDHMGILRIDVRSDYEEEKVLYELFSLITPELYELLGCKGVLTKAPIFAVERIKAIRKAGFTKSEHMLIGKAGFAYDGYWTIK